MGDLISLRTSVPTLSSSPSKTHCPAASANLACLSRLPSRALPSSVSSCSSKGSLCSARLPFIAHRASGFYDSALPSELSWSPAAGGKPPSSRLSNNLQQKIRSSFSERLMNKVEEAPASLATNDHDKHIQDMLLPSERGGDDHGKLNASVEVKPLLISESKVLTLPTILTLGRVAAIPILLVVFYSNEWWASTAVAFIFVLAAITDWLDGFLARKMGSNSTFGAFLDPVADKLMVATTLVLLSTKPLHISWAASLPWLIPLPSTAMIGREITMSAVREWAASQGENLQSAVAVNKLGKWKTAFQMVALTVLLATRNGSESSMVYILVSVGVGLLYISAALAIWSLFVYVKAIWGVLVR